MVDDATIGFIPGRVEKGPSRFDARAGLGKNRSAMRTTLDIPDEVASEVQRRADRDGRGLVEQIVRLVELGLRAADVPAAEFERFIRSVRVVEPSTLPLVPATAPRSPWPPIPRPGSRSSTARPARRSAP
jgi:hypothetical protein